MNTAKLLLLACLLSFHSMSNAQSSEEALHYLQEISSSIEEFRNETWNVLKFTVKSRSTVELEQRIQHLADKIETKRTELNKADGFYGDLSARVAMTVFLRTSHEILTDDFQAIRQLETKSAVSFTSMEKYLMAQNKANERLSEAGGRLDDELKRFAKRYKVEVTEEKGPLAKKIELASQALGYYNQVYLSYFKVYHQKLSVYAALKSEDLPAINDEIKKLNEYATEGLGRLMILDSFMEDNSLNEAATDIISQFKYEAEHVFPTALKSIERKHIFNMAQDVYEAIPEAERTQEDADHLNSLIDPLNHAIEKQNEEFSKSEVQRESLFNAWNNQIIAFFAAYLS